MDEQRKREIDAAWRKARRDQFVKDVRGTHPAFVIGVIALIAIVSSMVVLFRTRPTIVETVEGRIVTEFAPNQTKNTQGRGWRVVVKLDGGGNINLELPRGELPRRDTLMKIRHARRVLGPLTHDDYHFAGYVDAAD